MNQNKIKISQNLNLLNSTSHFLLDTFAALKYKTDLMRSVSPLAPRHPGDQFTGDISDSSAASTTVTVGSDMTVIANFSKMMSTWVIGAIVVGGMIVVGGIFWLLTRKQKVQT